MKISKILLTIIARKVHSLFSKLCTFLKITFQRIILLKHKFNQIWTHVWLIELLIKNTLKVTPGCCKRRPQGMEIYGLSNWKCGNRQQSLGCRLASRVWSLAIFLGMSARSPTMILKCTTIQAFRNCSENFGDKHSQTTQNGMIGFEYLFPSYDTVFLYTGKPSGTRYKMRSCDF